MKKLIFLLFFIPSVVFATTVVYDDTIQTVTNKAISQSDIQGDLVVTSDGDGLSMTTSHMGGVVIATGVGDYDLPDTCDSATGSNVILYVRDASETVSLTVSASEDSINFPGLSLDANDELDSPGNAGDYVSVICLETNEWYVIGYSGSWTDGGTAD